MSTVPETLHAYNPSTMVVRAIDALLALMPGTSKVVPYATPGDAAVACSLTRASRCGPR